MKTTDYESWWGMECPTRNMEKVSYHLIEEAIELRNANTVEDVLLESGDCLAYITLTLIEHGLTIQQAMDANVEKLTNRKKYGKGKHGKRS